MRRLTATEQENRIPKPHVGKALAHIGEIDAVTCGGKDGQEHREPVKQEKQYVDGNDALDQPCEHLFAEDRVLLDELAEVVKTGSCATRYPVSLL